MQKSLFYHGHHVVVVVTEHVFGRWEWTYRIEGQGTFVSHGAWEPSSGLAMEQAISHARSRIDRRYAKLALPERG